MQTEVLRVDARNPDPALIERAAEVIRAGGPVAFPTETVYGLGANALDSGAVERIFEAKGRHAGNPLIVHVADVDSARGLVTEWPDSADKLASVFWPGPLTLILVRAVCVPDVVTAGGATVGIRAPAHPIARALLSLAGVPIAAPSANRSNRLSPTTASHVLRDLDGRIEIILDGGPTPGGIESTVLDLTEDPPRILRPGPIQAHAISKVIEQVVSEGAEKEALPFRSPGRMPRHYAPRTPLIVSRHGRETVDSLLEQGLRVGWLAFAGASIPPAPNLIVTQAPVDRNEYAAHLYAALHELDDLDLDRIVVDSPPDSAEWDAIRDRLSRAAVQE